MPHWSARIVISFLFSPAVVIPVVLAALGIAFTVALAPTIRNIRLAHWFFAVAAIWMCGGILRWLLQGEIQMRYLTSFFACGLIGTLWLASYEWVEGNYREQVPRQDKPAEKTTDKKENDKKKEGVAQKKDDKHKTPPKVTQESHGDNSPNLTGNTVTQGPGSIAQVGGSGNTATIVNAGPPPLAISDEQQKKIANSVASFAKDFEGQRINISIHNGNPETSEFGNRLSAAFKMAGFQTNLGPVTFIGASLARGVTIRFGKNRELIANALAESLVTSKVVKACYPAKGMNDDDFLIIVAP